MTTVNESHEWELEFQPQGGLLVSGGGCPELQWGDVLELTLRLSTGAPIRFPARVVSTSDAGAWIELVDLSVKERREFRRWQAQVIRTLGTNRIPAQIECKIRFRRYSRSTPTERTPASWSGDLVSGPVYA